MTIYCYKNVSSTLSVQVQDTLFSIIACHVTLVNYINNFTVTAIGVSAFSLQFQFGVWSRGFDVP